MGGRARVRVRVRVRRQLYNHHHLRLILQSVQGSVQVQTIQELPEPWTEPSAQFRSTPKPEPKLEFCSVQVQFRPWFRTKLSHHYWWGHPTLGHIWAPGHCTGGSQSGISRHVRSHLCLMEFKTKLLFYTAAVLPWFLVEIQRLCEDQRWENRIETTWPLNQICYTPFPPHFLHF